ncbi:MAG: dTMP kinase [Phycisphaerales bacterium]|nr:dTMP kinase [Phycisphaerales bacterium]
MPQDDRTQDAPLAWLRSLSGRFVVFDGPDGSGKSTQLARFAAACASAGVEVCEVREPGGTAIGERIRAVLLDRRHEGMSLRCEMLLYMASRAQLVEERIRPALDAGRLVLADRFVSSTLAYQGTAGGLPLGDIEAVARIATGGVMPDLTVVFDVDPRTIIQRTRGEDSKVVRGRGGVAGMKDLFSDRMEDKSADAEFRAKVRQGYLDQAAAQPDRYAVVDGTKPPDEVWERLLVTVRERLAPGA